MPQFQLEDCVEDLSHIQYVAMHQMFYIFDYGNTSDLQALTVAAMGGSGASSEMQRLLNLLSSHRDAPIMNSTPKLKYKINKTRVGKSYCKFCNSGNNLKSMSKNYIFKQKSENYSTMILACYNIKIEEMKKSNVVQSICEICINRLRDAFTFRKQIETAIKSQIKFIEKDANKTNKKNNTVCETNTNAEIKTESMDLPLDGSGELFDVDDDHEENDEAFEMNDEFDQNGEAFEISDEFERKGEAFNINDEEFATELSKKELLAANDKSSNVPFLYQHNYQEIPALDPGTVTCPKCNVSFDDHRSLLKHHYAHYGRHRCDVCDRSFTSAIGLSIHMSSHAHVIKPYKCKSCPKTYGNSGSLGQHVRKVHKKLCIHCCPECEERFLSWEARNQHLYEAHGVTLPTYVCATCGKVYKTSSKLATHQRRTHYKIKEYFCAECDSVFFSKCELENHIMKHTGTRNFECDECGKTYPRKKTLREHMKIHANIRAHKCNICDKSFIQKCTLKYHLKMHLRELEESAS